MSRTAKVLRFGEAPPPLEQSISYVEQLSASVNSAAAPLPPVEVLDSECSAADLFGFYLNGSTLQI